MYIANTIGEDTRIGSYNAVQTNGGHAMRVMWMVRYIARNGDDRDEFVFATNAIDAAALVLGGPSKLNATRTLVWVRSLAR